MAIDNSSAISQNPALQAYEPIILQPGGKATEMQAQVTRAMWDDYVKRFQPSSDALISSTGLMNPSLYTTQVQEGALKVNKSYDVAAQNQTTALSRYGLARSGEQQKYGQIQDNVNRSASVVDAANRIRQRIAARDQAIALGGGGQ